MKHTLSAMSRKMRSKTPEWLTAIFTGILAFTTMWALGYARGQLGEMHQEAQINHLITLVRQFDQEPMATYRRQMAEKRLKNDEDPMEFYRVLDFCETVERLIQRDYLNEEDVWNQFSYWILHINADPVLRSNLDYEQKRDPNEYAGYISLLARIQRIEGAHRGRTSQLGADDVRHFYEEEKTIVGDSGK